MVESDETDNTGVLRSALRGGGDCCLTVLSSGRAIGRERYQGRFPVPARSEWLVWVAIGGRRISRGGCIACIPLHRSAGIGRLLVALAL
jgi:hypothetical protein